MFQYIFRTNTTHCNADIFSVFLRELGQQIMRVLRPRFSFFCDNELFLYPGRQIGLLHVTVRVRWRATVESQNGSDDKMNEFRPSLCAVAPASFCSPKTCFFGSYSALMWAAYCCNCLMWVASLVVLPGLLPACYLPASAQIGSTKRIFARSGSCLVSSSSRPHPTPRG